MLAPRANWRIAAHRRRAFSTLARDLTSLAGACSARRRASVEFGGCAWDAPALRIMRVASKRGGGDAWREALLLVLGYHGGELHNATGRGKRRPTVVRGDVASVR